MTNPTPTPNLDSQPTKKTQTLPGPLQCLSAALISGGFATALYFLTSSIAQTFASKPLATTNPTALNISVAVRTFVVGISTLATAIFGIVTVGLVALAIQVSIQQLRRTSPP